MPSVERIRTDLPGFDYVLVSSTHNHEGPDTLGLWGSSPFTSGIDKDYIKTVEGQVVAAVKTADGAAKPVTARLGTAQAPDLLNDNREPYVKHDELVAVEFRGKDDKPAGLLVQWNCHPETRGSKNTEITADFVGTTVKYLSEKHKCPVVYLTGTVGGLMTSLHVEVKDDKGKKLPEESWEKTERYGLLVGELADKALASAKGVKLTPIEVRRREVFVPMENKLYQLARQLGVLEREAFAWTGDPYKAGTADPGKAIRLCRWRSVGCGSATWRRPRFPARFIRNWYLTRCRIPLIPAPTSRTLPIRPGIYKQMKGKHRMLIGLANDEIGYIIPKRQWDVKPPFCYGRTKAQYGEENSVGPDTAPILCQAFKDLVAGKK